MENSFNHQVDNNRIQGDFVFLRADNLRLLLPLQDVLDTAYLETDKVAIENLPKIANSIWGTFGYTTFNSKLTEGMPQLAVSETLTLLPEIPKSRYVSIHMKGADTLLCWTEMQVLTQQNLQVTRIPSQFLEDNTPLRALVIIDEKPVFLSSATSLLTYLLPDSMV